MRQTCYSTQCNLLMNDSFLAYNSWIENSPGIFYCCSQSFGPAGGPNWPQFLDQTMHIVYLWTVKLFIPLKVLFANLTGGLLQRKIPLHSDFSSGWCIPCVLGWHITSQSMLKLSVFFIPGWNCKIVVMYLQADVLCIKELLQRHKSWKYLINQVITYFYMIEQTAKRNLFLFFFFAKSLVILWILFSK